MQNFLVKMVSAHNTDCKESTERVTYLKAVASVKQHGLQEEGLDAITTFGA